VPGRASATSTACGDGGAAAAALVEVGEPPSGRVLTRRSWRWPLNHGLSAISNKAKDEPENIVGYVIQGCLGIRQTHIWISQSNDRDVRV
jgi:hypothetical protein